MDVRNLCCPFVLKCCSFSAAYGFRCKVGQLRSAVISGLKSVFHLTALHSSASPSTDLALRTPFNLDQETTTPSHSESTPTMQPKTSTTPTSTDQNSFPIPTLPQLGDNVCVTFHALSDLIFTWPLVHTSMPSSLCNCVHFLL